ncbi:porin [Caballeronia sp. ATUFL_M1_KS5A]|uniref:porin n=1 Tax=Caballeronia sp. ATUFL_M1_KS5A TaxID=2921778 RepID=UPI00202853A3|nr:porin [Caballeronia sp. ATUFL_M1_KS5A]
MNAAIKRGLAMAALSQFVAGASAQTVNISGSVDEGYRRIGGADTMAPSNSTRDIVLFTGNEDLGGGNSIFFYIQNRFTLANGQMNGANAVDPVTSKSGKQTLNPNVDLTQQPYRQDWIGWRNNLIGDVRLGRMQFPLQELNGNYDAFDTSTVASVHTGGVEASMRTNGTIYFRSAFFYGFRLHVAYATRDNGGTQGFIQTPTTVGQPMALSNSVAPEGAGLEYNHGAVSLSLAYDRNGANLKSTGAYGSYNFGWFKAFTQLEQAQMDYNGTMDRRWSVSVAIPFGVGNKVKVGYLQSNNTALPGISKKFGIGVDYSLSKLTTVYTDFAKMGGKENTQANNLPRFDIGLWHRF